MESAEEEEKSHVRPVAGKDNVLIVPEEEAPQGWMEIGKIATFVVEQEDVAIVGVEEL